MQIVGCDFHPSWQQVAVFDPETGELTEQRLVNGAGEAERLGHEVWVRDEAQSVTRLDEGFRKQYQARCHHKLKGVDKVATARKLAVRLYWMLRQNVGYPEIAHIESSPRVALVGTSQTDELNGRSRIQQ